MIIDYDDMIASGMVKEASDFLHDESGAVYAITLNTPSGSVGKFRITTNDDINNSIAAINKNAALENYIKNPAMYYIQKAANDAGIDTGWSVPEKHYSRFIDYAPKQPDEAPLYIFKMAGHNDHEITSETDYKYAVDMFNSSSSMFTPTERIAIAGDLLKVAMRIGVPCDPTVSAYAYAEYSPNVNLMLDARINMAPDDETKKMYTMIKQAYDANNKMPPDVFICAVETTDKLAGIHRDASCFFKP